MTEPPPDEEFEIRPIIPPTYVAPSFTCPHCSAFAQQTWDHWHVGSMGIRGIASALCEVCREKSWWLLPKATNQPPHMIWPSIKPGVAPHAEMPERPRVLYEEARAIAAASPRAAIALLRVAVDVLLREVVPNAKGNLNDVVGLAVKGGLPPRVQQTLDSLRVIGNEAVHPEQIVMDQENAPEIYEVLSRLLNVVVEQMISIPRQTAEMFAALPESKRAQIQERDARTSEESQPG